MKNSKVIFFGFTPYHIRTSNYFSEKKYANFEKYIFITEVPHTRKDVLENIVKSTLFTGIYLIDFNFRGWDFVKNIHRLRIYKNKFKIELENTLDLITELNPDQVVLYSDDLVPYQLIINHIKINIPKCKIVLVEEGTARYITSFEVSTKIKIKYMIDKFVYGSQNVELIYHGQNNNIDKVYLREPQLINYKNDNIEKVEITNDEFKDMIMYSANKTSLVENNSVLFAPTTTTYNKKYMLEIYNKIFKFYNSTNKHVYVKLHPAEKYIDEIVELVDKYNEYIHILNEVGTTSDDYILNMNIDTVISDYSSTLINACYLRDDINILTYCDILEQQYGVKSNVKLSIFDMFIKIGKIKKMKI